MSRSRATILRRTGAAAAAVLMLAAAFVAGRGSVSAVSGAAADPVRQSGDATVWTVREETVGRSLTFSGRITASTTPGPVSRADGVVTSIDVAAVAEIEAGTVLYTVDLRPVVAAEGPIPGFRQLGQGDRGRDVRQLRDFLCGQGRRSACGDSERFDSGLAWAVRGWQEDLGLVADAVVRPGDILWFPSLPARVRPSEGLELGAAAPAGERPYIVDSGDTRLRVEVSREQAALVPEGSPAMVAGGHEAMVGAVAPAGGSGDERTEPESAGGGDEFELSVLAAGSDEPFCAAHRRTCAELVGGAESVAVDVVVHTVPERAGPAVPVAAIETDARGRTQVRTADGRQVPVEVITVAGGVAIVDGLAPGDRVLVP